MVSTPLLRPDADGPLRLPAFDPAAGNGSAPTHVNIPLSYYWLLVRRYLGRISSAVLLVTAAVALLGLSMSKTYQATVVVRVDPSGLRVVGDTSAPGGGGSDDARLLVSTEANVITSPAVEQDLIDSLHLGDLAEFRPEMPTNAPAMARQDQLLRNVAKHISVSQPLDTYLLDINFRSKDPVLAAHAANGLAAVFIEHEYATRAKALTDSTAYLSSQIDLMRARMERDQIALVNYESKNDVINADDKSNIYQSRLDEINSQLTAAEERRMSLQADAMVASGSALDQLLASPRGQALVPLRDRLLADQRELSHLATIYGPAHPLYRQQEMVVANDKEVLQEQEQHVSAQIRAQYQMALQDEQLLRGSLQAEKRAVDAFDLRAVRYQALKAAADSSTSLYYDLQKQIQDSTVAAGQRSEDLRVISPAIPSDLAVSPRVKLWVALAFLLSAIAGVGVAILIGFLDKSVSSPEQVEAWFKLPAVGTLPLASGKAHKSDLAPWRSEVGRLPEPDTLADDLPAERRHSAFHEAILGLHSALSFAMQGDIVCLAVTSSVPGEGKSTVTSNLAAAFAALGRKTVLVDADMRKPTTHRLFNLANRAGLSSVLRGRLNVADALVAVSPHLSILPAGPAVISPAELLHQHLEEVLDQLTPRFEVVLVDCPPVLGFADANHVAQRVGRVLIVTYAGSTNRDNLGAAVRQLSAAGANIVGVVLNRVSREIGHYYGYYNSYGYSQYYSDESAGN
jgi:succinoglycan biosynthesis transport protein ExoP